MWIRIGSFLVKEAQAEHLRNVYNELALPKVRAQAGNIGCMLLEPSDAGEPYLVMTLWESRGAADDYESSGTAAEVVLLVRDFFAAPPTLRSYESASLAGLPSFGTAQSAPSS